MPSDVDSKPVSPSDAQALAPKPVLVRRPEILDLTGARFFAAFAVVGYHFSPIVKGMPPWLHPIFDLSGPAVSFFFMLSGLVLSYVYTDAILQVRIGWWEFFNLRLGRLYPMHLTALLLYTIPGALLVSNKLGLQAAWASWILTAVCLQVYVPFRDIAWRWNGPSWSIACELFFYALCPFLIRRFSRRYGGWVSLLSAATVIYLADNIVYYLIAKAPYSFPAIAGGLWPEASVMIRYIWPIMRLPEFAIGLLLGMMVIRSRGTGDGLDRWMSHTWVRNLLLLSGLAMLYIEGMLPWGQYPPVYANLQSHLASMPACGLLMLTCAWGRTVASLVLSAKPMVLLGEASYSFYLLHPISLMASKQIVYYGGPANVTILSMILLTIGISILAYRFVETPCRMAWRKATLAGHEVFRGDAQRDQQSSLAATSLDKPLENRAR